MDRGRASVRAFSTIAIVLFIVGALITGYYIGYVQHRQGTLTKLRSRAIAQIAERVQARFTAIDAVSKSLVEMPCKTPPSAADFLKVREGPKPDKTVVFTHYGFGVHEEMAGTDPYLVANVRDEKEGGEQVCELRMHLEKMFSASITRDLFDDYALVLLPGTKVLYQHRAHTTGKLLSLEPLLKARAECPSGQLFGPPKQASPTPTPASIEVPVGRFCVKQHGEDYQLFTQIVAVEQLGKADGPAQNGNGAAPEQEEEPQLMVVGMLSQSRLVGEARSVSSNWLSILAVLMLSAILAAPFLKLRYVGERERLRALDVYLVLTAIVLGAGFVTIAVMSVYSYRWHSHQLDDDLTDFANEIAANFQRELGTVLREVCRYTGIEGIDRKQLIYPYFSNLLLIGENGKPCAAFKRCQSNGTNLECGEGDRVGPLITAPELDLADRQYFIRAKDGVKSKLWSLDGKRFAAASVQSRASGEKTVGVAVPYGVACDGGRSCEETTCFREPVHDGCDAKVVVLATRLHSVIEPIVPLGFGFAIINDDGEVLFHSDSTRNTEENMFLEAEEKEVLRSLFSARLAGHVDVSYEGADHRFYLRDLSGVPWYLITFRNEELWREVHFGISGLAGLSFLIYVLFFLAFFVLARMFGALPRRYRADWLWPNPRWTLRYAAAAVLLALLLAIVGATRAFDLPSSVSMICLPFVGIVLVRIVLYTPGNIDAPPESYGAIPYRLAHHALVLTLLLTVAVTPAVIAYYDAHAVGMAALLKRREAALARDIRSRSDESRNRLLCEESYEPDDWYRTSDVNIEGKLGTTTCKMSVRGGTRTVEETGASDSNATNWFCATDGATEASSRKVVPTSLALLLIDRLPGEFGNRVAFFRDAFHNQSNDRSWKSQIGNGHLTYTSCGLPQMHEIDWHGAWFRIQTPVDPVPYPRDELDFLSLWAGFFLVLSLAYWAANRIFVIRAERDGDYDGLAWPQPPATSNPKVAWELCSEDEKLTLFQLAEENFVNPNRWREIRRLRQAGLLRRDPALRMDSKLHRFVLGALPKRKVEELEQGGRPSVWVELRMPLLALSLLIAGFFLLTQPDVFNSAVAIATALAGALAFVPRILASLGSTERKPEK